MNGKRKSRIQKRFLIGLIAMEVVLSLVLCTVVGLNYRNQMEEYYSDIAFDAATLISKTVNADKITEYAETLEKDDYYEEFRQTLIQIKQSFGLEYAYVVIPTEECQFYIWDGGDDGEEGILTLGDKEDYYGEGKEIMRGAYLNPGERNILITDDSGSDEHDYGYLASAYIAIIGSDGVATGEACVDISMDDINTQIRNFEIVISLIIVFLSVLFIITCFLFIRKSIILPINKLTFATSSLVRDNMDDLSEFDLHIKTNDEIETLADSFTAMAHELQHYIANLTAVTAEKERIGAELDVATHIQSSMLPCVFPAFPDRPEFDIYATMTPAKEVGGDFYDFFMIDDNHLAIVVADVSGKGVPAALFMVIGKTLIKDHTSPDCSLDKVFATVNNILCEANSEGMFITAYECVIDLATGEATFVNAGHENPFIYRKNQSFDADVSKHNFVLAGMENSRYRLGTFTLDEGDKLFQYTDGVTEARNVSGELYGIERLTSALNTVKDSLPNEILFAVKRDIDNFAGEEPQFDDITMICFEYRKKMNK